MIDLSLLTDGGVGWLDASGPASHLVLSTRIRLARNLAGHVFQGRNSETDREEILGSVEDAARESVLLRRATRFRLDRLDRIDRQLLHELFARLAREFETALVVVTHNRLLAGRADRVLSLEGGRLVPLSGVESMP